METSKNEKLIAHPNKQDPSKFHNHFLYKSLILVIFLVIIPLIPSQAPEFITQTLLTRNWELLHLVFVGIAISYGLFSRRNHETEKENNSKFDNAQSIVSRFLQVSSLFEDEVEIETETSSGFDENKVQTWNNQYHRSQSDTNVGILEKPLLLPVRSLKSRVSDQSISASSSVSKRFPNNSNKLKESVVLPSPIPWRSRSGKLEKKKQEEADISTQESEFSKLESRSIKFQTLRSSSSRPNSMSSSPSSLLSSESLAKNAEDLVRKKGFYKSFPPPPPPPPPPMFQKSISMMKPRSTSTSLNQEASFGKELKRSFTSGRVEKNSQREAEENSMEEPKKHVSFRTDKLMGHGGRVPLELEKEKERFLDKVIVESYEDTETEDDEIGESFIQKEDSVEISSKANNEGASSSVSTDEGPDVDKKADEFIAKFREQIRLQRIESIKRSARNTRNSSRLS